MRSGFPWLSHNASLICIANAGSRPGGRDTFLLCGKKVSKEAHPPHRRRCRCLRSSRLTRPGQIEKLARTSPAQTASAQRFRRELRHFVSTPHPSPLPLGARETTDRSIATGCPLPFKGSDGGGDGIHPLLARRTQGESCGVVRLGCLSVASSKPAA